MKTKVPHKTRLLCRVRFNWTSAAWKLAMARRCAFALGALWLLAGSCLATELPVPAPLRIGALPLDGSIAAENAGNQRFDLVIVEPKGRGPRGFRFQIVLDSNLRDAESLLDLAANEAGLLVTARDVDGIGNDLDLIIKSARSFTPIGIWINNHHGGFIKADAGVYAPSIWSEVPLLFSANPTDTFQRAILLWHQSCVRPPTQRFPGERRTRQGLVDRADLDVPSRLSMEPYQTRGPPLPFFINS
jgi:hypothetical protein